MSRHEPENRAGRPDPTPGRVRAYLHRFFTSWVADDPEPTYSTLDRADGLGQVPDPVCESRVEVPESVEVVEQVAGGDRTHQVVGDRTHQVVGGRSSR